MYLVLYAEQESELNLQLTCPGLSKKLCLSILYVHILYHRFMWCVMTVLSVALFRAPFVSCIFSLSILYQIVSWPSWSCPPWWTAYAGGSSSESKGWCSVLPFGFSCFFPPLNMNQSISVYYFFLSGIDWLTS